jgi:hypothetical protein
MMIKKPNFLILGAAKAGTTSLCDILRQHPQVYFPLYKETTFFSNDIYYNRGMNWYLNTFFNKTDNYLACGEASPQYLYWAEKTAPRIREALGSETVRFIIILREPVSRAYSWYWNMVKEGNENLSFENAIEAEPARLKKNHELLDKSGQMIYGYLRGGRYAEQIEFFLSLFPRENFLFLLFDDLSNQFEVVSFQLKSFLKIDPSFVLEPAYSNQATRSVNRNLRKWFRKQSPIKDILRKIISPELRYHIKELALKVNNRPFSYPTMPRSTANALKAQFANDNIRLEKIIGRDLSSWNED